MPCLPSTSISSTGLPFEASARASAAATVVFPVPPLPVTTCSRTPSQSVSRTLTFTRLSGPTTPSGRGRPGGVSVPLAAQVGRGRPTMTRLRFGPTRANRTEKVPAMDALIGFAVFVAAGGLIMVSRSIKQVQQYEQGIVYRFGRVLPRTRSPGITFVRPIGDRLVKVNLQQEAMPVPAQEGITRDNISVRVDAVVDFRVVDPIKAKVNVRNYLNNVSQQAQTTLRSVIGQSEMDELLSERDRVNRQLLRIIDELTEGPWGVKVDRVEIKDVSLPEGMKRSIARQAEAERERRARIITADGEYQASKRLAAAANIMARDPAALQLRLLQTVVEVASEKNSTLVMPIPVELLRFFDKGSGQ